MKNIQYLLLSILILSSFSVSAFAYYHPEEGRWVTRDPIEERGGVNVYGFVSNNGVTYWDYIGLKTARFCPNKWWIVPLPDKLVWDLDPQEIARIKELEELIKCIQGSDGGTADERQAAINAAKAYIQAIKDYQPRCGRACVPGYTCTFNFDRYEGKESAWKAFAAAGFEGVCCGFEAGIWYAAMCPGGCETEDGFNPKEHEDQDDGEWYYHWHDAPHEKRGGGPHWDRGKKDGLKPRPQEWSPDGQEWFPK